MKYLMILEDGEAVSSNEFSDDYQRNCAEGALAVYRFEKGNFEEATVADLEEDAFEVSWSVVGPA